MSDDDFYQSQRDPDRIFIYTTTGSVQAWRSDDTAISVSFNLVPREGGPGHAQFLQFMMTADARSLAKALLRAADHADALVQPALAEAGQ